MINPINTNAENNHNIRGPIVCSQKEYDKKCENSTIDMMIKYFPRNCFIVYYSSQCKLRVHYDDHQYIKLFANQFVCNCLALIKKNLILDNIKLK